MSVNRNRPARMPDEITGEQVTAAVKLLGFDPAQVRDLAVVAGEVSVTLVAVNGFNDAHRTYVTKWTKNTP